jgi:hypothetical protein
MNKKPIYTDFLNAQWKPVPMFYGFKPNVRPYILPRNRGKLPMPKSGHIQFGEVAAIAKAEFNPLPNYQELQLPGKMFSSVPAPQQKFLNAATVKLINSGKVKAQFRADQKINPLSMPIVGQMANNNLKLISLEMIKNAVVGLKRDPTLGTEQQQLQARTSYDNLIVSYAALVDRKQDDPENVKKLIAQYEKEMIAIYGPSIKKAVPEDVLNSVVDKIKEVDSSLARLYTLIQTNAISKPAVEGDLVPGEFGEKEEVEGEAEGEAEGEEVKGPSEEELVARYTMLTGEAPDVVLQTEASLKARFKQLLVSYKTPNDIIKTYSSPEVRKPLSLGSIYLFEKEPEKRMDELFKVIKTLGWGTSQDFKEQHLLFKIYNTLAADYKRLIGDPGDEYKKLNKKSNSLTQKNSGQIMQKIKLLAMNIRDALIEANVLKSKQIKQSPEPEGKEGDNIDDIIDKLINGKPVHIINLLIEEDDFQKASTTLMNRLLGLRAGVKVLATSGLSKNLDAIIRSSPQFAGVQIDNMKDDDDDKLRPDNIDNTITDQLGRIVEIYNLLEEEEEEEPEQQIQGAEGRKRKSRKRPTRKSVKKLSPNINAAIMRLLKS